MNFSDPDNLLSNERSSPSSTSAHVSSSLHAPAQKRDSTVESQYEHPVTGSAGGVAIDLPATPGAMSSGALKSCLRNKAVSSSDPSSKRRDEGRSTRQVRFKEPERHTTPPSYLSYDLAPESGVLQEDLPESFERSPPVVPTTIFLSDSSYRPSNLRHDHSNVRFSVSPCSGDSGTDASRGQLSMDLDTRGRCAVSTPLLTHNTLDFEHLLTFDPEFEPPML